MRDAVLRIGEVCGVEGRKIYVQVDKNKNLSDMFFDGDMPLKINVKPLPEFARPQSDTRKFSAVVPPAKKA